MKIEQEMPNLLNFAKSCFCSEIDIKKLNVRGTALTDTGLIFLN